MALSALGLSLALGFGTLGPLDDVRGEVHESNSGSSSGSSSSSSSSSSDDDDDSSSGSDGVLSSILCLLLCGGGVGRSSASSGAPPVDRAPIFSRRSWSYPYYGEEPGYFLDPQDPRHERGRRWRGRVAVDAGYVFEGLARTSADLHFGLGIAEVRTTWDWLYDPNTRDSLALGDANLMFAVIRRPHFSFRAGGGARIMVDSQPAVPGKSGPAAGYNVGAGLTLYPFEPLIFDVRADVGTLGSTTAWKVGGRAGAMVGRAEVFLAADHTRVGDVGLSALRVGVGAWF